MRLKILKLGIVKSTNNEAIKLIKKNNLIPSLIYTNNQTNGKGTGGKKWVSKKGNLFISIYFEHNDKKNKPEQISLLNPAVIKNILKKYTNFNIKIKWPNDLLIKNKKICGILQEVITFKSKKYLIIGIGINTLHAPHGRNFKSISLNECSKNKVNNLNILENIKKSYEKLISDITRHNINYLKKNYYKI